MKAPRFWDPEGAAAPRLLLKPLSWPWRAATWLRRRTVRPESVGKPVICVGNLVMGGAGKTPTVQLLAAWFRQQGVTPGVLVRGYGGSLSKQGATLIDPAEHRAAEAGDEALLHAVHGPTVVAADRRAGARLLARHADIILMDDGHQNPSLAKALSIIVVDTGFGFGNGAVFPAGPLRETVAKGLARANAAIAIGPGTPDRWLKRAALPVLRGMLRPDPAAARLSGQAVYAFSGIARPAKFLDTLEEIGATIAGSRAFADHHPFSDGEIETVLAEAGRLGAIPVTTAKDAVRLPDRFRERVTVVEVTLALDEPDRLDALLRPLLASAKASGRGADTPENG